MLQELKKEKHEDCLHWFPSSWHDTIETSLLRNGSAGVLIAINPKSHIKIVKAMKIEAGRCLLLKIKWCDITLHICNVYNKSGGDTSDIEERSQLHNKICNDSRFGTEERPLENLIIGGDWNCIQSQIDKSHPGDYGTQNAIEFADFEASRGLIDWWR